MGAGIGVPELWVATHKGSATRRLEPGVFELVKATVDDPALNFGVVPIAAATAASFEAGAWPELRDPFDRFPAASGAPKVTVAAFVATSLELGLVLVSADRAIREVGGPAVVW